MNDHLTSASSPLDLGPIPGQRLDGGPPPLPGPAGSPPIDEDATRTPRDGGGATGAHRAFALLRRSPVRRDSHRGLLGGVCAGLARSTGLSVIAIRVIAVLTALLPGTVGGLYLLTWGLLPDEDGNVHAERAMLDGRPRSLVIVALGGMALIGMLSWAFNTWPLLVGAGVVILVLLNKMGRSRTPHHPVG